MSDSYYNFKKSLNHILFSASSLLSVSFSSFFSPSLFEFVFLSCYVFSFFYVKMFSQVSGNLWVLFAFEGEAI